MTATNHALTGALVGLSLGNPWLALPAAFVSHFVLDAIPHFGFKGRLSDEELLWRPAFKILLVIEALLCFAIVFTVWFVQPEHWLLGAVCAFVAASPDLYSLPRFIEVNGWSSKKTQWNAFRRFHSGIQTERIWGAWVELAWLIAVISLLVSLLR